MKRTHGSRLAPLLCLLLCGTAPRQRLITDDDNPGIPTEIPVGMEAPPSGRAPLLVRWMVHNIRRGMFINLPIMDTNPNRGITYGVMPIWVLKGRSETRIEQIHAPSVTYNRTFQWIPTYRYYYYPTPKATYELRASVSKHTDREVMAQMQDMDFLGRGIAMNARFQYDFDGAKRFYGIGPDTPESAETDYTRKILQYSFRAGIPMLEESGLRFNVAHHLAGTGIANGVVDPVRDIKDLFPEQVPTHWHQDGEFQLFVDYDTRDEPVTTSRGSYAKVMVENSQRGFGSEYAFQRYNVDLRHFRRWTDDTRFVTGGRFHYEQLKGDAPFYLLPSLGGKYMHRGYGAGRYVARGVMMTTLEQRFTVYKVAMAGVTTELEVAPFLGIGTAFHSPKRMAQRYFRPEYGAAFRAVARPQVVGSIDVGCGQEGPAVFMDINYSF
ncbi:MAG: BamA/TamA family outer membrane protein [Elusimicrobiota bacterium]